MSKSKQLRKLMREKDVVLSVGAFDIVSARVIERMGVDTLWVSSFGTSASMIGYPDANFVGLGELLDFVNRMDNGTNSPIIVDADNGYGSAVNVIRTVKELIKAGASCAMIEDQVFPKHCGLYPGHRPIIDQDVMCGRIKAAKDAQTDPDFMLMARSDAFGAGLGLSGAIERGEAYAEAGADLILPISRDLDDVVAFARAWKSSTPIVIVPTLWPSVTAAQVKEWGFKLNIYSVQVWQAALKGVRDFIGALQTSGGVASSQEHMLKFSELLDLVDLQQIVAWEEKYIPGGSHVTT